MGIIQKQALRSTVVNMVGIGFGSVTRLLMPFVLKSSQLGIIALLDSFSGIFVVIFNLGYNLILKRIFPNYRDEENGHAGFLLFGILLTLVGVILGVGIYYLLEDYLLANKGSEGELLRPYAYLIPILILFRTLFVNIDGYVRMLFKTVIGTFLDGLASKLIFLLAILLYVYAIINFDYFVYLYCFTLSFPGIAIVIYAFFKTKKIKWPSKKILSNSAQIKSYVLFGILSGSSYSIVQYMDILMINKLSAVNPESMVGIYSVMFFAALLISIPAKNMNRISGVIIAESWKENDLDNIQDIYAKSATNLLVIGGFLFVVGWACIDSVLTFLPEYQIGKYAFFFLGIAKLIELGTGVNAEIIETSEKYRYNTYFNLFLAVLVVLFNYFLIIAYGIVGAAIASFLAMTIINILRATLLKKSYGLWPFKTLFFKIAGVVTLFIIAVSFIDYSANPILKLILNAVIVSIAYWSIMIGFNLSPEIREWLLKMKRRFIG